MEVSSTMRHVHVIVLSLITLETVVKVRMCVEGRVYVCVCVCVCVLCVRVCGWVCSCVYACETYLKLIRYCPVLALNYIWFLHSYFAPMLTLTRLPYCVSAS